jgi:hypothetical protein
MMEGCEMDTQNHRRGQPEAVCLVAAVLSLVTILPATLLAGSIVAWGYNGYGQCNVPSPNTGFVAIALGGCHSLGLKSDGSIVIFGENDYSQCNVPLPNTDFVAIAAGNTYSLGLKSDGSIMAWGDNREGQCNVPLPNTDFVAVASGVWHSLGLKSDGSIVAWGYNFCGQCNVPSPNTGFIAIAAGTLHSLGLKSDGSIVAWGDNYSGECNVPSPNTGFIAIAAGTLHSLGLKSDGSIAAWGDNSVGQCNVPSLNMGFVALTSGFLHSLAIKQDGSIVAWGYNYFGECNVPSPNTGFIAIAAGGNHSFGLVGIQTSQTFPEMVLSPVVGDLEVIHPGETCSGTKWCFNQHKECDSNGIGHCLGGGIKRTDDTNAWDLNLRNDLDNGKPVYATAPGVVDDNFAGVENPSESYGRVLIKHDYYGNKWWSGYLHMGNIQVVRGQEVNTSTVIGYISNVGAPLGNHLHFAVYRGENTSGGLISFDVPIVSRTISLQTAPEPNITPLPGPIESNEPNKDKLIVIVHGWFPPPDFGWITPGEEKQWSIEMSNAIWEMIHDGKIDSSWTVMPWAWDSNTVKPWDAVTKGKKEGKALAKSIVDPNRWSHVHLIGYSAGSAVIGQAAEELVIQRIRGNFSGNIHLTFLDPYTPNEERYIYGATLDTDRDWADNYYSYEGYCYFFLPNTCTDTFSNGSTSGPFSYAHNVDISGVDPSVNDHRFPREWYHATITGQYPNGHPLNDDNIFNGNEYGFPRGLESGEPNWLKSLTLPLGNPPVGTPSKLVSGVQKTKATFKKIQSVADGIVVSSVTGIKNILGNGIKLITESPVWAHTAIEMPQGTNYIKFTYRFEGAGNGYLTAYFNENLILIGDQRLDGNDIQDSGKILVSDLLTSTNWLTLRLDRIDDAKASVFVSNIEIGTITNPADFNDDFRVDMRDFAAFAAKWQREDCNENNLWCDGADFDKTGVVDINDILAFTENWLWVMPKHIPSDLDFSTRVNFGDFNILAGQWAADCNSPDWCYGSDFDKSGKVDILDLAIFAENWLEGVVP